MVAGTKTKDLRTVFLAFLAVLTVQCVHSLTAPTPTHTQTMYVSPTHTQTMHSTEEMATISTLPKSTAAVCNSNMNCTQNEYCDELENLNIPGVCQSCHGSCEGCSGPGNMDCTRCNATSFIVQHVVYDGETTTPTGPNTTVQTTVATTTARTTIMTTSWRITSRATDVTDKITSSSTHPNATTTMTTNSMSTETTPAEPRNYTIKVECVDECPGDLETPSSTSKLCCHPACKQSNGCYGSSPSDCCHSNCTNGCYGDGGEKCCPEGCDRDYGCDHNGRCRASDGGPTLPPPPLPTWAYGLIGGGGAIVLTGGIIAISCCIRRTNCKGRPRGESDGGEERLEMKKRKTKKKKRNSYVPSPNSVREMNEDGPYANGEYVDPAGVSNPALQPDDGAYDDVNVHPDAVYVEPHPDQFNPDEVYVEPQPDQFNPDSTDDGIYDQPPPEEVNRHVGYGYHDNSPAQQEAVYGNDPDPVSGEQYPVSGEQYPVSADHEYPVSGDIDQSGFTSVEPVYQNTGFAAQANETQPDLQIYQNLEESNPHPAAHEDLPVYYDYTAQHGNSGFPPPPPEDDEQCLSVDSQNSFPSLPPPLPPGDLSRFPPTPSRR